MRKFAPSALVSLSVATLLALLAGCQSYERLPLDLDKHQKEWNARNPAGSNVATFAAELAKRDRNQRGIYDPADGLTLAEAEVVALFFNADLRTKRLEAGVALAGALEAGRWQDPQLNVEAGAILASISQPWFLAGSISFTLPLSGRPGVEKDKAFAEHRAQWADVIRAEWQLLGELRQAWFQLAATQTERELAEQQQIDIQKTQETARSLMEVGDVSAAEVRVFEIEAVRLKVRIQSLRRESATLRLRVLQLLGLVPEAPIELIATLEFSPTLPAVPAATARERNLGLAEKKAKYEVAEQNLRLEIRKQYPDLTIGPGYEIEGGQSRIGLGFGIPIPIINLNRQGIAEARAARLAAKSAFEAEYEHLVSALAEADNELKRATEIRESLERDLIPVMNKQVENVMEQARLSKFDAVLVLEAFRSRYEARQELVEARLNEAQSRARMAELFGPTYEPSPVPTGGEK
jgi:cobalt-zinc-cadmium efflux system outer membrane protein